MLLNQHHHCFTLGIANGTTALVINYYYSIHIHIFSFSPLRYKSLSSLQSATDLISPIHSTTTTTTTPIIAHLLKKCSSTGTTHAHGTLDSSRSGGGQTTSGESTSKLPEKKTRRNSRPRSLNLVWENLHLPSKDKLMTKKLYVHHHHHLEHTLYL